MCGELKSATAVPPWSLVKLNFCSFFCRCCIHCCHLLQNCLIFVVYPHAKHNNIFLCMLQEIPQMLQNVSIMLDVFCTYIRWTALFHCKGNTHLLIVLLQTNVLLLLMINVAFGYIIVFKILHKFLQCFIRVYTLMRKMSHVQVQSISLNGCYISQHTPKIC
jgi:hypothetical protein